MTPERLSLHQQYAFMMKDSDPIKHRILELCNEIAVLRNSEGVNAEEYEKRCEALQGAIAQRDAARATLETLGAWFAKTITDAEVDGAEQEELYGHQAAAYWRGMVNVAECGLKVLHGTDGSSTSIYETDLSVEYTVTGKVTDLRVVHLPSGHVAMRQNIRSRGRAMQEVLSELEWRLQQDECHE